MFLMVKRDFLKATCACAWDGMNLGHGSCQCSIPVGLIASSFKLIWAFAFCPVFLLPTREVHQEWTRVSWLFKGRSMQPLFPLPSEGREEQPAPRLRGRASVDAFCGARKLGELCRGPAVALAWTLGNQNGEASCVVLFSQGSRQTLTYCTERVGDWSMPVWSSLDGVSVGTCLPADRFQSSHELK